MAQKDFDLAASDFNLTDGEKAKLEKLVASLASADNIDQALRNSKASQKVEKAARRYLYYLATAAQVGG